MLQDTQAYLVIFAESWDWGPSKGNYVHCFFDGFLLCAFIWMNYQALLL
jgi:hypothetical protein